MPAPHAIYTRPSDQVAGLATITIETGTDTGDPDYGPESLVDTNPAKLAKIDSTTAAWLFSFGSAQRVDLFAAIHGTFEPGCDLRLQGNATNSWGSPSFDAEVPVLAWLGNGVGRWPQNQWLDLTEEEDYNPAGFAFWRLICSGNPQNVHLGQVVMSPIIRRMDPDLRWDYVRAPRKRSIINETAFGSKTVYSRHTTQFFLEGDQRMTEALFREQETHWYDAEGSALPWLLIPNGEEPEVFFGRWAEDVSSTKHHFFDVRDRRFRFEELSRGVRPGN